MKNYFNKAIFYKEWRNIRAVAIIFYLQVLAMIVMPFMNMVDNTNNGYYREMSKSEIFLMKKQEIFMFLENRDVFVITTILIIAIATCIVGYDLIGRKYDILSSMPFKKTEVIFTKWIFIFITIIIPLAIGYLSIYVVYYMNIDELSKYVTARMVLTWIGMNLLVSIFVFTFIMLIQCLSGICGLGGIIGSIFLVLPMGLEGFINELISLFAFSKDLNHFQMIQDKIYNICSSLTLPSYCFRIRYENERTGSDLFGLYRTDRYYMNIKLRIVILITVTIVAFVLMMYAFNKFQFEKTGNIILFKPLEPIFKLGVSICFGLLGATITSSITKSHYDLWNLREMKAPELVSLNNRAFTLTILMGVLCGCLVYVITNKILEANKK